MTLGEFVKKYGNNAYISIKGYCEEAQYDCGFAVMGTGRG